MDSEFRTLSTKWLDLRFEPKNYLDTREVYWNWRGDLAPGKGHSIAFALLIPPRPLQGTVYVCRIIALVLCGTLRQIEAEVSRDMEQKKYFPCP